MSLKLVAAIAMSGLAAFGQTTGSSSAAKAAPASGPIPRLANGKPDLNGVWQRPYVPDMTRSTPDGTQKGPGKMPYTAEYEAKWKAYDAAEFDYTGHCLPQGLTRSMNSPFPIQIVQTPKVTAILYEAWNVFEIVPTDGTQHPKDPDPTWIGNQVGHWDGDTLVVDTIGFNDKTNMDTVGHPHSDAMHTVERFSMTDPTHIAYEITIEDNKAFTEPWKNSRIFTLRPDWHIMEYSCEENNKEVREGHIK